MRREPEEANSGGTITTDTLGFFVHDEVGSVAATVRENMGGSNQIMVRTSYDTWGKARPVLATGGATPYQDPAPPMEVG